VSDTTSIDVDDDVELHIDGVVGGLGVSGVVDDEVRIRLDMLY